MEVLRIEDFLQVQGYTSSGDRKTTAKEVINRIKQFLEGKAPKEWLITEFQGKKLSKPILRLKASYFGKETISKSGLELAIRENKLPVKVAVKEENLRKAKPDSQTKSRATEILVYPIE